MEKISLTIDVSKISKANIKDNTFTTKEGATVTKKELKLDLVPLKEPKHIKSGDGWQMWKTHFVAEQQTDEERTAKAKSNIIGDGIMFRNIDAQDSSQKVEKDTVNESEIPF